MKKFLSLILALALCLGLSVPATAVEEENNEGISLVSNMIQKINDGNISGYIEMFNVQNQEEMNRFLAEEGADSFFQERTIVLNDIKKLSHDVGCRAALVTADELAKFTNIEVYYTKETVQVKSNAIAIENGERRHVYITGLESGVRKIIRGTVPNAAIIATAGEGFGDEGTIIVPRAELVRPSHIRVRLTKAENLAYYGLSSEATRSINFDTYLKNGIPCEVSMSYYGTLPEWVKACALAYKMYGWYCVLHPQLDYAPYYADLYDNSNNQNFNVTSYNALSSKYQGYVDSALSDISKVAATKGVGGGEENLFVTQYRANTGSQGSGILNQTAARAMAKDDGATYQDIFHYYYDNSTATGNNLVHFRTHG